MTLSLPLRLLSLSCLIACTGACSLPADVTARADAPAGASAQVASGKAPPSMADPSPASEVVDEAAPFTTRALNTFNEPWAMTFLPDGRALVTEKRGVLKLVTVGGDSVDVAGVPAVAYGGQGGLGDVVLHPDFASNRFVYLSHVEADGSSKGAVVVRYRLTLTESGATLSDRKLIWTQTKTTGGGHFGHRIAFGPDGMLWITSGDRQKFDPAQDMASNLGKVIRLFDDGRVPTDNPFAGRGGVTAQIWSLGHRNPLGIAFDAKGQLWTHEMGPKHGDELNLIERGANYGYPIVSNGDHYDGRVIPDHVTRPEFNAPEYSWVPAISPAGFIIYSGARFPQWRGNGLMGGLSSQALIRIEFNGNTGREAARYPMGARIREVEQGPGGEVYVLEDGASGRLLRLDPTP